MRTVRLRAQAEAGRSLIDMSWGSSGLLSCKGGVDAADEAAEQLVGAATHRSGPEGGQLAQHLEPHPERQARAGLGRLDQHFEVALHPGLPATVGAGQASYDSARRLDR